MAFIGTNTTDSWHVLLEVALDGGTVRYADQDIAMNNGTAYDGRIESIPVLRLSTGALLDPRLVSPSMTISLRDADSVVRDSTDGEEWGNRAVTIRIGQGTTIGDYEVVFLGVVAFPGGMQWDATSLRFSVDDIRSKDALTLPATRLEPATYGNMEESAKYLPIPLVYGDWQTTAGGGEQLPAYQIDSTAGTGGKFKIASHALKSIQKVWKDASDITSNCSLDAANGEFTITTGTYTAANTVTVNVQGATHNGATGGTLLQSLPDILEDIFKTHMGVSSGNIDSTAFAAWESELGTNDYGRRWIGADISSDDLIRDCLLEGFADITIEAGAYKPVYRVVDTGSISTSWQSANIRERTDGSKDFSVQRDPERIFTNDVVADYRYAPTAASYKVTYSKQNAASISSLGTTKRRRMAFNWLYITAGAETRTNREAFLFSTEPEVPTIGLDPEALTKGPTDQFLLTHSKFVATPMQIRTINLDLLAKKATATCWNMNRLAPGHWSGSSAPVWGSATALQKIDQGFWTDSNGRADASDADSTGSVWF